MDSTTVAVTAPPEETTRQPAKKEEPLVLRLRRPVVQDGPRVTWAEGVVDNEHLGRLKSNCCCIYTRPRQWDDPTTWEQDEHETEHCRGHTLPPDQEKRLAGHKDEDEEKKKDNHNHHPGCC